MKQFLLLSLLIGLQTLAQAQGDCASMLADANTARDQKNYITAVQKYNAVRKCDPAREREANGEILRIFETLKRLKDEADKARALADAKTKQAEAAEKDAQAAREEAEQSDRIGKNAAVAIRAARTNPVVGLRMAQFLMRKDSNAYVATAVFNDIFAKTEQFYKKQFIPFSGRPLSVVTFSPDGKHLLIAAGDEVGLFLLNGDKVQSYLGFEGEVAGAAFLDEGKRVLISSAGVAKIWDTRTGQMLQAFFDLAAAAASPNGKNFALAGIEGRVTLHSSADSLPTTTAFDTGIEGISKIAVSPDLAAVITISAATDASFSPSAGTVEKPTILVWSSDNGLVVDTLQGQEDKVWSVCFSSGGELALTGSDDNTAMTWSSGGKHQTLSGHTNDVNCAVFSNDDKYVFTASDDNSVRQWDLKGGQVCEFKGHAKPVRSVACSPVGNWMASADDDGACLIWQVKSLVPNFNQNTSKTFKYTRQIPANSSPRNFFYSLCHDGETVLSCNNDSVRIAHLYKPESDKLFSVTALPTAVALSPDAQTVVTGYRNGALIRWNAESGAFRDSLKGHEGAIISIVFANDGRTFASASWDKSARIWDASSGSLKLALVGHPDRLESVAISRQGLVLTGSRDGTAKLWSNEGKVMKTMAGHTRNVSAVAFAPDGKTFVTGSWDKTARIWGLEGKEKAFLEGHLEEVTAVAFSLNGKSVLTGSVDNSVRIWATEGEEIAKLNGHSTDVAALACIGDSVIISADRRGGVFSWHTIERFIAEQVADMSIADMVKQDLELSEKEIAERNEPDLFMYSAEVQAKKQRWKEATALYERAYQLKPSHEAIVGIYRGCGQLKRPFDFAHVLSTADISSLRLFGQTLFEEEEHLDEAAKMLEKAESISHDSTSLRLLYQIAAYNDRAFDFDRFLRSEKAPELEYYGDYFDRTGQWALAAQLYEKAEAIQHSKERLLKMYRISLLTDKPFDANRFSRSEQAEELEYYGNYFLEQENPEQALQLYEQAETVQHSTQRLLHVYRTSLAANKPFDFQRFMASDSTKELSVYAYELYRTSKWDEAWPLYEKILSKKYSGYTLLQMQQIAQKTGRALDFNLFLQSKNPNEVSEFANYFYYEAQEAEYFRRSSEGSALDSLLAVEQAHWAKAKQLFDRLYTLRPAPSTLVHLYASSKKTGQEIEFSRFISAETPAELNEYAIYFYLTGELDKARVLYQKSDTLQRSSATLAGLYAVARKSNQKSELDKMFREMLRSGEPEDLLEYAGVVRPTVEMTSNKVPLEAFYRQAKQLEDKAFNLDPVEALQSKKRLALSYNTLGFDQLFVPDSIGTGPRGCELSILRGIELDPSNVYLYTNLPTAYLLQNRWEEAKKIYLQYKDLPCVPEEGAPYYYDAFIQDIDQLEGRGITHPDFNCVRHLVGQPMEDKPCKRR